MKYVEGNLLDMAEEDKFDIIIHGANCFNTMKSGIAGQIAERYPKAVAADLVTEKGDFRKLGLFTQAYIDGYRPQSTGGFKKRYSFTLINAYTQHRYGRGGHFVNYSAVARVFMQIKLLYDTNPSAPPRIGIPKIGAGLAGGDWDKIEEIIDDIGFCDITCVLYKGE